MTKNRKSLRPNFALIASDQEWSARSFESILGEAGYASMRAHSGRQAIEFAQSANPDAVFLDLALPDYGAFETCRRLRSETPAGAVTPIVLTSSGIIDRGQRIAAHTAGAWEILGQPIDAEVVLLKLDNLVKAKREFEELRDESLMDDIPGLYSMRGLTQRARELGAVASRVRAPFACVVVSPEFSVAPDSELDEEQITKRVVEHVGLTCRRVARCSDALGRISRTELAIVAPATTEEGAIALAGRLQQEVESAPLALGGAPLGLRLRTGLSAVPNFAEATVDAVEFLLRAWTTMRDARLDAQQRRISGFDGVSLASAD